MGFAHMRPGGGVKYLSPRFFFTKKDFFLLRVAWKVEIKTFLAKKNIEQIL